MLAADTGQNTFRHAASILRGRVSGHIAIDDSEALRHLTAFPLARRREAVGIVAADMAKADGKKIDTRRPAAPKVPKNETDEMDVSADSISKPDP